MTEIKNLESATGLNLHYINSILQNYRNKILFEGQVDYLTWQIKIEKRDNAIEVLTNEITSATI